MARTIIVFLMLAAGMWCFLSATSASAAPDGQASRPIGRAALPIGQEQAGNIDGSRLAAIDREPGVWLTPGRDWERTYYSPLDRVNEANVRDLGFGWQFKTNTYRGLEATPIVVDGVMFTSGNWGLVYALDASTGRLLWSFDPHADGQVARFAGDDAVNRGVAVWQGKVYVVSLDCRAFALDARTGVPLWERATAHGPGYNCSGAPLIAGRVVVIGNAGGDQGRGGVRGYITALDLQTGAPRWRFYTVPKAGDPHPTPDMKTAEATWDPRRDRSFGGGGAAWDGMVFDGAQNLVMFGTGNAAPYLSTRELNGRALDRLYAASIVAVDADDGHLVWHYQTTPGDMWDFDATAPLVIADLAIDGSERKTVMQANKNGYFYVLDRTTGAPISVHPFTYITWSSGMDAKYRPIVAPDADYTEKPRIIYPSIAGAHSWAPMSFSPKTGFVYIPTIDAPTVLVNLERNAGATVTFQDGSTGPVGLFPDKDYNPAELKPLYGEVPRLPQMNPATGKPIIRSSLKAWDPVRQRVAWEQELSKDYLVSDGGAMSTAGNLVFAGREDGSFVAYAADSGRILKVLQTGTATMSAPMTYEIDGTQYIAVMQGHGGSDMSSFAGTAAMRRLNEDRILVFKLGGAADIPQPSERTSQPYERPPARVGTADQIAAGRSLFYTWCAKCHSLGVPAVTPDLGRLEGGIGDPKVFAAIVLKGALVSRGMSRFNDVLSNSDADELHDFLVDEAWKRYDAMPAPAPQSFGTE